MAKVGHYSSLDRLLHRLAFASPAIQLMAADFEDAIYGSMFRDIPSSRPVFITSLPRAGTTIILSALNRLPGFGTHLYRDMPFVMAPVLWSRRSQRARKPTPTRERSHGDGIQIDIDSPEAFEEIIWRAFWPDKYTDTGIQLWTGQDAHPDALEFLNNHFRKIVALRCADRAPVGRYLSKNNANIARVDFITRYMPQATIVVPVRRPLDHAASLLLQHRNFLALHQQDPFSVRYMADIGHLEFGALHRPILFPGFGEARRGLSPDGIDYWVAYWIAAFEYLVSKQSCLELVSYEGLCHGKADAVADLCRRLQIDPEGRLEELASVFRQPKTHTDLTAAVAPELRARAESLYASMCAGWQRAGQPT